MHSFGGFLKDRYFVLVFTTLVAFVAVQVQVVEAAVLPVRLRQALVSPSRFALPTGRSLVDPSPCVLILLLSPFVFVLMCLR